MSESWFDGEVYRNGCEAVAGAGLVGMVGVNHGAVGAQRLGGVGK